MRSEVSFFVFLITGQVLRLSIQRGLREFFRFSKGASFPEMIREHLKPDPDRNIPSEKFSRESDVLTPGINLPISRVKMVTMRNKCDFQLRGVR